MYRVYQGNNLFNVNLVPYYQEKRKKLLGKNANYVGINEVKSLSSKDAEEYVNLESDQVQKI